MGNYLGCSIISSKPTTAKFFDAQGRLQRIELPVKAAELMLEAPGSVICPVDELHKTRGVSALRADEDLQAGKLYLMFPAKRVYCKLSELEMKLITAACRIKGKKRLAVAPNVPEEEGVCSNNKILGEEDQHGCAGFPGYKLAHSKRWRPVLAPISEVVSKPQYEYPPLSTKHKLTFIQLRHHS